MCIQCLLEHVCGAFSACWTVATREVTAGAHVHSNDQECHAAAHTQQHECFACDFPTHRMQPTFVYGVQAFSFTTSSRAQALESGRGYRTSMAAHALVTDVQCSLGRSSESQTQRRRLFLCRLQKRLKSCKLKQLLELSLPRDLEGTMSDGPITPIGSPGTFEEGMFAATTRCVRSSPALNCPLLIGSAVL